MSVATRPKSRPPLYDLLFAVGGILLLGLFLKLFALPFLASQDPSLHRAELSIRAGKIDQARAQLDRYLREKPNSPERYTQALQICMAANRFDLVKEYATRGIQACKDSPPTERAVLYSQLANADVEMQEPAPQSQAIEAARRAYELAPDDPLNQNMLGYLLADNRTDPQDLNEAETLICRAMTSVKSPVTDMDKFDLAMFSDSYAWVQFKKGRYAQAVNVLTQTIDDMPPRLAGNAETMKIIYYHLGAAYSHNGQPEQARHALQASLRYDPNYAPARQEIATLIPDSTPSTLPATH